eukprot:2940688-Amphidinium_carterae.1
MDRSATMYCDCSLSSLPQALTCLRWSQMASNAVAKLTSHSNTPASASCFKAIIPHRCETCVVSTPAMGCKFWVHAAPGSGNEQHQRHAKACHTASEHMIKMVLAISSNLPHTCRTWL